VDSFLTSEVKVEKMQQGASSTFQLELKSTPKEEILQVVGR